MMPITFTKMHGLGNDFMVIDGINQKLALTPKLISALAQRHTGIGFDQCLVIESSPKAGIDFKYRIFNADGNEVGQCGNGARCLALFAKYYGLTQKNTLKVATNTTEMTLHINSDTSVSVDMGIPQLDPKVIPLLAQNQSATYVLDLEEGHNIAIHAISVGNPHAVVLVNDLDNAPVAHLGKTISLHDRFPEQANASFMRILSPNHIQLRVYERGCGETQACGSAAVAAAAIGRLYHQLASTITVSLLGGDLAVSWPKLDGPITLTGPAHFVYEGKLLRLQG